MGTIESFFMSLNEWSGLIACAGILVSLVLYWLDRAASIKNEMNEEIDKIYDFYYRNLTKTDKKDLYHERVQYMSMLNRLARQANSSRYRMKIVNEQAGKFLLRLDEDFIHSIILQRRRQFKRESYYVQLEKMIETLRTENGKNMGKS